MSNHTYQNTPHSDLFRVLSFFVISGAISIIVLLQGCAPRGVVVESQPMDKPPVPITTVYFYPTKGQSQEQQDRDRYECYRWAVQQTGFDPGQAQLAPHQRIQVTPAAPPGSDTAAGAMTGAVVGTMMSPRRDSGFGMVFGAITGAMIGAASDEERRRQAEQVQQQYDAIDAQRYARVEKQSRDYQRAMTACLEGRGYTVR
jgi:hypothetical protein